MKYITILLTALVINTASQAQQLVMQGIVPNIYLNHKVAPKESWYSVSRLYNVNVKELAKYNNTTTEGGLAIAQTIKVPLTKYNYNVAPIAGEAAIPITHTVEKSEGLYRIAVNAGTTMQALRTYNNLTSDVLSTGTTLILGYLTVKNADSPLAGSGVIVPQVQPVIVATPLPETITQPKVQSPKPSVVTPQPRASQPEPTKAVVGNGKSFFKEAYTQQTKQNLTATGTCAVFKTMAGWADNKYYALIDGLPSGSIIEITNIRTNKTIYAKVLGQMQEMKQNNGLKIRVSNATASALEEQAETFEVIIKY